MELSKQVASLELSKRLKELGVKQESLFYWYPLPEGGHRVLLGNQSKFFGVDIIVSAYTVTELGEMLPDEMCDEHEDFAYYLTCQKRIDPDYWIVYYYDEDRGKLGNDTFEERTEADARAEMLVYLLENGLLKA